MRLHTLRAAGLGALVLALASCADQDPLAPAAPPSLATTAAAGPVIVISEIMADPNRVTDANGEWFEVYNGGTAPVDLQGWRITSGPSGSETHVIASSVVVQPGAFAVFGNNANSATNGGATVNYQYPSGIAINNSNTDWLTLKSAAGVLVDSVAYAVRTNGTPGSYTPPRGASRALIEVCGDNEIVGGPAWRTSTEAYGLGDFGTPGSGPGARVCDVVVAGEPDSVAVAETSVTVGASKQLSAVAYDSAGQVTQTTFTWTSSLPGVLSVNPATGVATGVSEGVAFVTATSANGVAGTAQVTVTVPGGVASISLSINTPRQAPVGYTKPAFATVRSLEGTVISPPPALTWTTSNPAVATVDSLGYITALSEGTVTVRATAGNGIFGQTTFTVIPADAFTPAVYRDHEAFGRPVDGTPADEHVVEKRQYVASWNAARGGPNWVSWNINASHFGQAPRCDCFSSDRTLPSEFPPVVDFNYRNGGYDRGHMVQSESRTTTDQENASTFLMTNILPQAGENNQGPWSKLENYLNDLARQQGKEIYVVAGGQYAAAPPTLKNEGVVAVPDYTWKVAVVMDGGEGLADARTTDDVRVIAIKMPNLTTAGVPASAVGIRNDPWEMYETTVDSIEAAVGYDLLAALPDRVERLVESKDRAPVAATDGPYTVVEGATVTLDGSASSDPDGDALVYAWDFGDGTTGEGVRPTHVYADNGSYVVKLTVTDPYGAESEATTSVTVFNVAPQVTAIAGATLLPGETYRVDGAFSDPGADQWTATVDYGDGSGAQPLALEGQSFSLRHTYAAPGTYTVEVTVRDDDGDASTRTAVVTVLSAGQAIGNLQAQVSALAGTIGHGNANAMNSLLRNANASLERGSAEAGANQLEAFVNQVEARVASGRLSAAQGDALIAAARRIIASL
ncbi:MAG TPA: DNA/RNA non-specific endonuclease [Longimicrobium sp.]|nr:DNA/RNA non-specific endonuclease [Longimicrobium sp.]